MAAAAKTRSKALKIREGDKDAAPAATELGAKKCDKCGCGGQKRHWVDKREDPAPKASKVDAEPNDANWVAPNYDDKSWFNRESQRCQVCDKSHEGPAAASACVVSHKKLRCYFCLTFRDDTEALFRHLRVNHDDKKAEKVDHLLCPYCDEAVLFKTVSSHVISTHLWDMVKDRQVTGPAKRKTAAKAAGTSKSKSRPNSRASAVALQKAPKAKAKGKVEKKKKTVEDGEEGAGGRNTRGRRQGGQCG